MDIGERAGQLDTSDTSDTETRSADADAVTTVLAALAWLRQRTGWS